MVIEEFFIDIVVENNFEHFVYLIEQNKVDPSYDNNLALVISIEENKIKFVKYLLNLDLDLKSIEKLLFQQAIEYNSKDVLPLLVKDQRISTNFDNNFPLKFSLKHRNPHFIQLLLNEDDVINSIDFNWINKNIINKEEKKLLLLFYKIYDF
jgi:hypothetical protein